VSDTPKPKARTWWRRVLPASFFAALCLFCLGSCFFHASIQMWMNRVKFDSEAWKAAGDVSRYDMAWDLLHGELDGKTPGEVTELMGEPMGVETLKANQLPMYSTGPAKAGTTVWYYCIGHEKYEFQIGPTSALLAVDFENGRVVRARKIVH
jgi:hypothetical protein